MNCGWTCLVEYPFTDGTGSKVRPVLVISRDEFNKGDDVVVLPISSRPDKMDAYSVFIEQSSPAFLKSGLRLSSAVKWNKPFTIAKSLIIRRLGYLEANLLDQVAGAVRNVFPEP